MSPGTKHTQFTSTFRYFGSLQNLLKRKYCDGPIVYRFRGHPGVKDAIEAIRVEKAVIEHRLEPKTRLYYEDFHHCIDCDRIYWQGSHFEKINRWLATLSPSLSPIDILACCPSPQRCARRYICGSVDLTTIKRLRNYRASAARPGWWQDSVPKEGERTYTFGHGNPSQNSEISLSSRTDPCQVV